MKRSELKRKKGLNKVSPKQAARTVLWKATTDAVAEICGFRCVICGKRGTRSREEALPWLDGHHIIKRSKTFNDSAGNCAPVHRWECHEIADNTSPEKMRKLMSEYTRR